MTLIEQLENASKEFADKHGVSELLVIAAAAMGANIAINYMQELEKKDVQSLSSRSS